MEIGLYQNQTTNLIMTPELKQAINILQYSNIELSQFIQEQALENPLIEIIDSPKIEKYLSHTKKNNNDIEVDFTNLIADNKKGLKEILLDQLQLLKLNSMQRDILSHLVLNIDDNGYLRIDLKELAYQLKVKVQLIEECIKLLHQLEPIGVGARNLKECLLIQARILYPDQPILITVISKHLPLIADKKWKELSQKLNISINEITKIVKIIQSLNPKPGAGISHSTTQYIEADIIVEENKNGGYIILLNDSFLPRFKINQDYYKLINSTNKISNYIKDQYQKYLWLVKAIEQRRSTILKITKVIIENQLEFLKNGFSSLSPLTLKEIADEINVHESTVSRAIRNKFIQTPIGTFEMKNFFSSKIRMNNGENISSTKVKYLLKEFIDNENKQKPFSDQKIADYFNSIGINISRRTIAKYREELNILPSSKRKLLI